MISYGSAAFRRYKVTFPVPFNQRCCSFLQSSHLQFKWITIGLRTRNRVVFSVTCLLRGILTHFNLYQSLRKVTEWLHCISYWTARTCIHYLVYFKLNVPLSVIITKTYRIACIRYETPICCSFYMNFFESILGWLCSSSVAVWDFM